MKLIQLFLISLVLISATGRSIPLDDSDESEDSLLSEEQIVALETVDNIMTIAEVIREEDLVALIKTRTVQLLHQLLDLFKNDLKKELSGSRIQSTATMKAKNIA